MKKITPLNRHFDRGVLRQLVDDEWKNLGRKPVFQMRGPDKSGSLEMTKKINKKKVKMLLDAPNQLL